MKTNLVIVWNKRSLSRKHFSGIVINRLWGAQEAVSKHIVFLPLYKKKPLCTGWNVRLDTNLIPCITEQSLTQCTDMGLSGGTAFERHAAIWGDKDRPALFPQIILSRNNWLIFWYADTSQVLPRHQQHVCCLNTSLPFWDKEIPFSQKRKNLALYRYLVAPSGMDNIW